MISDSDNLDSVIEAVFAPNLKYPCTELHNMGQTKVYKVETPEPLVVRVVTEAQHGSMLQRAILEAINHDVTARILPSETRQIGEERLSIQVQTYLPGSPLGHYPSDDESRAIAETTHILHQRLCAISNVFTDDGIPSLGDISSGLIAAVAECSSKEAALQLFANCRYEELVSMEKQVLTYGDPWPQNYLFDQSLERSKVSIADVDPVFFGPKILQPAMLFAAYFVVSFLQNSPTGGQSLNLDELIGYWPEPINREDVLLMMQVYPILLTLRKMLMFDGTSQDDLVLHQANLALLRRCLEAVRQMS